MRFTETELATPMSYSVADKLRQFGYDEPCHYVYYSMSRFTKYTKKNGIRNSDKGNKNFALTAPTFGEMLAWLDKYYGLVPEWESRPKAIGRVIEVRLIRKEEGVKTNWCEEINSQFFDEMFSLVSWLTKFGFKNEQ